MMLAQTNMSSQRCEIGLIGMALIQIPDDACNPCIIVHACTLQCGADCNHPLLAPKIIPFIPENAPYNQKHWINGYMAGLFACKGYVHIREAGLAANKTLRTFVVHSIESAF